MSSVRRLRVRRLMPLLAMSLLLPLLSGVDPRAGRGRRGEPRLPRGGTRAPKRPRSGARDRRRDRPPAAARPGDGSDGRLEPVRDAALAGPECRYVPRHGLAADELAAARAWIGDNRARSGSRRRAPAPSRSSGTPKKSGAAARSRSSRRSAPSTPGSTVRSRSVSSTGSSRPSRPRSRRTPGIADRVTVSAQRAMQLAGARAGRGFSAADFRCPGRGPRQGDGDPRLHGPADGVAGRGADAAERRPARVVDPADRRAPAVRDRHVRGRPHGGDARPGEPRRLRDRQPRVGRVPREPADRLRLDGHAGDLVLGRRAGGATEWSGTRPRRRSGTCSRRTRA